MLDQGNRTFIGSVCFIDIIGYSKKSVSEQITMKDRFTALLSESLKDVATDQRIILDTGDGAAISFLGDPEDALFVSMHMREFLQHSLRSNTNDYLELRIGINLGPVKLIRDINGQPNIVGDGINVAQRIMSFAQPSQIVVSRSFYDVVSVISDEYAKLFQYEGSRTDKHVREHEIYIIGESAAAFDQAKAGMVDRAAITNTKVQMNEAAHAAGSYDHGTDDTEFANVAIQGKKKLIIVATVMGLLAIGLSAALVMKKSTKPSATDMAAKTPEVVQPTVTQSVSPEPAKIEPVKSDVPAAINAEPANPNIPAIAANVDATKTPDAASATPTAPPAVSLASAANATTKPVDERKPKAEATKSEIPKIAPGSVAFSIDPWGEVYVNGKLVGISPPLKQTKLTPGKYKIEIRNSKNFAPYTTSIDVKSKEETRIKYRFQ